MKHSTTASVLAFVAAVMVGMPCMAQEGTHSVWKKLPDMAVPRWEAGTVVLDDKLYVFGGYKMPTKACKRVDAFDPRDNSWTKLKDLPSAITHINMVLDGRSVWFAGGFKDGYKGYAISEVWRYDIDKNTCTAAVAGKWRTRDRRTQTPLYRRTQKGSRYLQPEALGA